MVFRGQVKENYTPQDVGVLLGVHHNTIKNWIRRGEVLAFTTVGGHFRVPRREVARLVAARGLPVPEELAGPAGVVYVLGRAGEAGDGLARGLGGDYRVLSFSDPFEGLMQMGRLAPDLLVLDLGVSGIDCSALARALHDGGGRRRVPVIGVGAPQRQADAAFAGIVGGGDAKELAEKARSLLEAAP